MTQVEHNEGARSRYLDEYGILSGAAIGVVVTRTREPLAVVDALRELAVIKEHPFKAWTMLKGWGSYNNEDPTAVPTFDSGSTEVLPALRAINGTNPNGSDGFPDKGIYVMMWPHFMLPRMPPMMQCLVEYARDFSANGKRLVLVVPLEFEVPKEIEDSITLLDYDVPTQDDLRIVLSELLEDFPDDKRPSFADEVTERLLSTGAGMTSSEFENALSRAVITQKHNLPNDLDMDSLVEHVAKVKTEVVKRSDVLELMPRSRMGDVGGLDLLKGWIELRRRCFTEEAREYGIDAPKGICLVGPPGTGKSLVAKAIADALGLSLIRFDVSRVFNSLVGSSEARVRSALKMVEAMAPCVVMLDELDKAFDMNSSGGDSGVGKRVLGAILTFMQESDEPIFWVMTANRTAGLPPEMLRKGRLDEVFSVTVPTEAERMEVLRIHLAKRGHSPDAIDDLDVAVAASAGYVAAEIEAAVKETLVVTFHDEIAVTGELIAEQFAHIKPLSEAFAEDFTAMQEWATNNARPSSTGSVQAAPRARSRTAPTSGNREMDLDG